MTQHGTNYTNDAHNTARPTPPRPVLRPPGPPRGAGRRFAAAIRALVAEMNDNGAKGHRAARARAWDELARRCGRDPLPLDAELVTVMGAAFKPAKARPPKTPFPEAGPPHN